MLNADNLLLLCLRQQRNFQLLSQQYQQLQRYQQQYLQQQHLQQQHLQQQHQQQQQLQQQQLQQQQLQHQRFSQTQPQQHLHPESQQNLQQPQNLLQSKQSEQQQNEPQQHIRQQQSGKKRKKLSEKLNHDNEVGQLLENICFHCFEKVHPNSMSHSCHRLTGYKKSEKLYKLENFHKLIKDIVPDESDYTVLFQLQLKDVFENSEQQFDMKVKTGKCVNIRHTKNLKGLKKNFHIIYSDEKPEVMRMFDENDLKEMIMPQNLSILSDKKVKKIQTLLRKSKTIKLSPYAFDLFVADRKKLQENFVVTTLSMNQGSV